VSLFTVSGEFRYVQVAQSFRRASTETNRPGSLTPGATTPSKTQWLQPALDNSDPYGDPVLGAYTQTDPFDGALGWLADNATPHFALDSPFNRLDSGKIYSSSLNDSLITYLMYLPAGGGSQWVPLRSSPWSYSITVTQIATGKWSSSNVSQSLTPSAVQIPFNVETQEPTWTQRMTNGTIF